MGENRPVQRPHYLAFGLIGYVAALLPMLYFAAFLAGVGVPKTVDRSPSETLEAYPSIPGAVALDLLLLVSFALVHSLLARRPVKLRLQALFPAELERSLYSLVAGAQIGLLCWAWRPIPGRVWTVSAQWPWLELLLWSLQGMGWGIIAVALLTLGHAHLFGLRQAWWAARGVPYAAPPLEGRGIYRWIRHPIYAGTLVALWATPEMSQGHLLLAAVFSAYLFIGLHFEERDLERQFGEAFREHRRGVPAFLPRLLK
jgi:methanethiol S-methyltransferase